MAKVPRKVSLTSQLYNMKVGDVLEFPISQRNSICSMVSNYSFDWKRKYTTRGDKKAGVLYVTRESMSRK